MFIRSITKENLTGQRLGRILTLSTKHPQVPNEYQRDPCYDRQTRKLHSRSRRDHVPVFSKAGQFLYLHYVFDATAFAAAPVNDPTGRLLTLWLSLTNP